jgi:hypothetical protein
MQASHSAAVTRARFDDPNLVSHAGLVPVMRLAEQIGMRDMVDRQMRIPGSTGANAGAKVCSIVAGMAAGADSIDDLGLLRHGAMSRLFTGIRAPSTLGTFLRGTCMGDVASLQAVARRTLTGLAGQVPLLPGAGQLAFLDIDSKTLQVYGGTKQGARTRYTGVRGLDYQITTLSAPHAAPVILDSRLRGGNAASGRGAASLVAASLATARAAGATGTLIVRGDSKFFQAKLISKIRAAGAHFSITVPNNAGIRRAISELAEHGRWTPIRYPRAIYDAEHDSWTSEAEIAETSYTAFTNATTHRGMTVTARLIVRRVRIQDRTEQGELLPAHRYHAVFTDSPSGLLTAEAQHRDHAIIEQVFADLTDSALAHFPSGKFAANAFWLTAATIAHNLTRAAATLAGGPHATARTGTLRRRLINVAARLSHSARTLTLHLPAAWPWQHAWQQLFTATHPRPSPA